MMLQRMAELSQRLEQNRKEAEALSNEMHAVIVEATFDGYTPTEIAGILGVSRQTVYTAVQKFKES